MGLRSAALAMTLALTAILFPLLGFSQPSSPPQFDPARQTHTEQELREFLKPIPPRSAEEALAAMEVIDGFEMQLVAAEPMVNDPIAAAFDEDGNLYVCEMRDYPFRPKEGNPALGRIRLLKDTDGDGRFDVSHIFAEDLLWVSGVAPWKGGVFATAAPDIWYLKDTNGDGKADIRRKAFTGFGDKKSQSIFNNLKWGLDHRIYGASSGNGGSVIAADHPGAKPIEIRRQDFRFHPGTLSFEVVPGRSQFGNTFNVWGQRFLCSQANAVFDIGDQWIRAAILAAPQRHAPAMAKTLLNTITKNDGETATGIIKSENAASITLLRIDAEETISRRDIKSIQASGLSLMPDGLHQALDVQGMADLLAYLRSSQYDLGTESDGFSPAR